MKLFRDLLGFFSIFSHHLINRRRQFLTLCLCCCFCPTFMLNLPERKCLWTNNSGYSRLICNDDLCKSIAIFHFIDKSVCHMPLKALVLTTHTVNMEWRVSISFYVWQNGTQSTIHNKQTLISSFSLPITWHSFLPTENCTLINGIQVWKKGSVIVRQKKLNDILI